MGNVIEEILGQLAWRGGTESRFSANRKTMDFTIDSAKQQLHRDTRVEATVLYRIDHARGDPPQATRRGVMRNCAQTVKHVDQATQMFGGALVTKPFQQRRLVAQAQAQRTRAQIPGGERHRTASGIRRQ